MTVAGESPAILPGALDGKLLADGIGRSDALSFSVARSAYTAKHGVDFVAVALCIGQALHQEKRCAFAHHEAVGSFSIGTRAGGGECADLAKLHKRGAPMLRSMPPVIATSKSCSTSPSIAELMAAIADAQAASHT